MDKEVSNEVKNSSKWDVISSIIVFIFGLTVFLMAVNMPVASITGSAQKWYLAPGIFPGLVGIGLMLQAVILFSSVKKSSGGLNKEDFKRAIVFLKTETFRRFIIALGLLTIYVFVLLGNVRYEIATFIYVFANILIFRENKFALWKIILISVICSVVVGYGFSHFARIPLP